MISKRLKPTNDGTVKLLGVEICSLEKVTVNYMKCFIYSEDNMIDICSSKKQ